MITEDYISYEIAKLLVKKGFDPIWIPGSKCTLQMAVKWLEEVHHILVVPNYIYEFTDTSWVYKIYRLGENGKPERYVIKGISYDKDNTPTEHVVGYRDYMISDHDYATRSEAEEEGIKYCLENLV